MAFPQIGSFEDRRIAMLSEISSVEGLKQHVLPFCATDKQDNREETRSWLRSSDLDFWKPSHALRLTEVSRDSAVSTISTPYGLDSIGVGVRVPVRSRIFFPPLRPDRLRDPPSLLSNVNRGLFPVG
jgi:hypothetical protein